MKLNLSHHGKTKQVELGESDTHVLIGKRIGEKIDGAAVGHSGFEFEITGGSDNCGFPMRKGVSGARRKKILVSASVGFSGKLRRLRKGKPYRRKPGLRRRKSVCPDGISESITQINMKVVTGDGELFPEAVAEGEASVETKEDSKTVKE